MNNEQALPAQTKVVFEIALKAFPTGIQYSRVKLLPAGTGTGTGTKSAKRNLPVGIHIRDQVGPRIGVRLPDFQAAVSMYYPFIQ